MALLIGQPINGRELEQETSPWPPERFASLCDALAWAASGQTCPRLPWFTTRVNAKDGGIDAQWSVDLPQDGRPIPTPILGPGWNVFQYKKRDLIAQDRRRIISQLKASLKGAVADVVKENNGRHPNHYILFVNVDLKGSDKSALKEKILEGYSGPSLRVEIIGAGELADAFLNNHPHLRAAYFTPHFFKTWQEANREHQAQKLIGLGVDLIGRGAELDRLRSLVDDSRVRVIVLSGPHDIGKSRLALEATRHRPHDVVLALDPRSLGLSDYTNLCADRGEVVCIVEDPEPDAIESLVNETLSLPNLKLIITLPTPANVPAPSYGRDERVQSLHLKPLAEEDTRKLLKATGQPLVFEIEDWIVRQAGGIPGVLLAAASVGNSIRHDQTSFAETVGREFERRIREELGPDALKCARLFSVLTHVGISGDVETELKHICDLFGEGWTAHPALLSLADLEMAGLARRGGSFAAMTLPLLANYLVVQSLRGRRAEMFALFGKLDEPGRIRFLRRLSEVKSEEVELFWDEMFAADGPFGSFETALSNIHLLRLIAGTVPEHTLRLLESGLCASSLEDRLAIADTQRRELMWTLEELLLRLKTSQKALRLVWLLAEAENENYANNATGVLAECFHPFHPQVPFLLQERIKLLHEFVSEESSLAGRLVAVKAVSNALDRVGIFFPLRYSTGPEPLDLRPAFTPEDFYNYCRDLVDTLIPLAEEEGEVAAVALSVLPELTAELGIQARPQEALERFGKLVDWARAGRPGLDVSSLSGALRLMRTALSNELDKPELPPDRHKEFTEYVTKLDQLKTDLETASFATRLKRWAGHWAYGDHEGDPARFEAELQKLADEAVRDPHLLNTDMVEWLLSPSAQRSNSFFLFLGNRDEGLIFRERIEDLGQRPDGAGAFSSYWGGWARRDREAAEQRLDQLAGLNAVTGAAVVRATDWLRVDQTAVNRVKTQIQTGRVDPEYVGRVLSTSRWIEKLTDTQFEELLQTIAGHTFAHVATAIDILSAWVHHNRPLRTTLADFAWRCLEQDPPVKTLADPWHFDQLAARLAQDDPERGFRLLEKLVQRDESERDHWDPLNQYGGHKFWDVLYARDRRQLIGLLLNTARKDALWRFRVSWRLRKLLDQEGDKGLLLSFARDDSEHARIIAECITTAKPGFWPIAFELCQRYPHDEILTQNLTAGIEQQGTIIEGPFSQFYEARKREVEQILHEPSTPPEVRAWLREVVSRLERRIPREIVWEYDMDVDDLRRHIEDKDSAQRIWAIGRVLKYATWEDVRRLLTVEDIEEALPLIDLPEKRRRMLEKAVEVWRRGQ
jgi:hypothetical protein